MKNTIVILILILSTSYTLVAQEQEKVKATYENFEAGIYYFKDKDDFSLEFGLIDETVLKEYNLMDTKFKGKVFMVTFISEPEIDDSNEDILISKIVALKPMD